MNRYEALRIAVEAHAAQKDKCGMDYVLHPMAVAAQLEHTEVVPQNDAVIVALLHDVLEDTDFPLGSEHFGKDQGAIYHALLALTHHPNQTYAEYIDIVCGSELAAIVKLADLWHNLQPERQDCLPEKERKGLEKRYLKARDRIWEALGYEWWPEETD